MRLAAAVLSLAVVAAPLRPCALRAQSAGRDTTPILLWPSGAPGALGDTPADRPSITPYFPSSAAWTGTAALVFPGGGYEHLATDKEGTQIARWLNGLGVAAFVVRYRLGPRYHDPAMSQDAIRAMRVVRSHARDWDLDRVGVVGFSAGGHMAATVATHADAGNVRSSDPVERMPSYADFMLLAYPVVTMMDPYAHKGSRTELLGDSASQDAMRSASNELHVTASTSKAFIVATTDDASVPVENSLMLYRALHAAGVPVELHLFQHGRHGFGLAAGDSVLSQWPTLAAAWLRANGLLTLPIH